MEKCAIFLMGVVTVAGCTDAGGDDRAMPFTAAFVPQDSVLLVTDSADPLGAAADIVMWDGRVAVSDRLAHNVKVFEPDGHLSMTIGRLGDGPGEFRSPASLTVDDRGRLGVLSLLHGKVSFFTRRGDLVDEFRFDGGFTKGMVAVSEGRQLLIATHLLNPETRTTTTPYGIHVFDRSGRVDDSFGRLPEQRFRAEGPFLGMHATVVSDSLAVWGITGRRTFFLRVLASADTDRETIDSVRLEGLTEPNWDRAPQGLGPLYDWAIQYPMLMGIFAGPGVAVGWLQGGDARKGEEWYRYAIVSTDRMRTIAITERTRFLVQKIIDDRAFGVTIEDDGDAYLKQYGLGALLRGQQ